LRCLILVEEPLTPNEGEIVGLRAIVEGTVRSTGDDFFASLVGHLTAAVDVDDAFVVEFAGSPTRVRSLADWGLGGLRPSIEFDLDGTPCEEVVRGNLCHHPRGVKEMMDAFVYMESTGLDRGPLSVVRCLQPCPRSIRI
jgi:hypothetical protein